jgi:hypothetical protein
VQTYLLYDITGGKFDSLPISFLLTSIPSFSTKLAQAQILRSSLALPQGYLYVQGKVKASCI